MSFIVPMLDTMRLIFSVMFSSIAGNALDMI